MPEPGTATQTWLTVEPPWLCRTWVSGPTTTSVVTHCTSHWHRDTQGRVVSDDPAWVPVAGADFTLDGATDAQLAYRDALLHWLRGMARTPQVMPIASRPTVRRWVATQVWPVGPFGLWTQPPGHPAYALPDYRGDPYAASYGWCTWYAQYRRMDERLMRLGNAWQWAYNAPRYGLRVGTRPVVGATAVFQPGVEGASRLGHVAHVEAVYSGGWFLVAEMSAYLNGGGWGRVSFRYALAATGVSFIY
jgi:hypothetical protein